MDEFIIYLFLLINIAAEIDIFNKNMMAYFDIK